MNDKTKKIAIIQNNRVENSARTAFELYNTLKLNGYDSEVSEISDMKDGYDFVFVIGGDGTLLRAAKFYAKSETPVFGVNLGRLGFLAQTKESELSNSISKFSKGEYKIESRLMLESEGNLALNDFVIKGSSTSRTSRFYLKINDKFVCDYIADGIIVSTPTGSTAYGLSAGGPVLFPMLDAIVVVPICPHTLTARPLVVPSNEIISISACEDCATFVVAADGESIGDFGSSITIKKSSQKAMLALLDDDEFYFVLRDKLHWGVSPIS